MELDRLTRSDLGDNFICTACAVKHVKVAVVTRHVTHGHNVIHVIITTFLIPLVLLIQLSEQELHSPEKVKVFVNAKEDFHHAKALHKKAGKKRKATA